jgi:hypothetical protein
LQDQYRAVAAEPYEAVYVEIDGEFLDRSAGAFAADYDGTVSLKRLHSMARADAAICRTGQIPEAQPPRATSQPHTYVFVCDQQTAYTVQATQSEAWVFLPAGALRLPAVGAEHGGRYADATSELWIEGEQARLSLNRGAPKPCHNDTRRAVWEQAKLGGADFRAVGNEPGWHLEIREGRRILLATDYGASRVELPLPEAVASGMRTSAALTWKYPMSFRGFPRSADCE